MAGKPYAKKRYGAYFIGVLLALVWVFGVVVMVRDEPLHALGLLILVISLLLIFLLPDRARLSKLLLYTVLLPFFLVVGLVALALTLVFAVPTLPFLGIYSLWWGEGAGFPRRLTNNGKKLFGWLFDRVISGLS